MSPIPTSQTSAYRLSTQLPNIPLVSSLPAAHTCVWPGDKTTLRLRGLRFATQYTPPTWEAWPPPKTNKMFLRNKATCADPPEAGKNGTSGSHNRSAVAPALCSPILWAVRRQRTDLARPWSWRGPLPAALQGPQALSKCTKPLLSATTFLCSSKIKKSKVPFSTAPEPR